MGNFTKISLLLALWLFAGVAMAQQTIYVNTSATGANDGTSWTNAYTNLQVAIDVATTGDRIWVAKGVYYPITKLDPAGTDRDKTFILKEGVKVYGGFFGNENKDTFDLNNRDFVTNETILSGDFNNDDVATLDADGVILGITNTSENAHHVVVSYNNTSATLLDGFTIKGGAADGTGTVIVEEDGLEYDFNRANGGGLYSRFSSPTISNLLITANLAYSAGGGAYYSTGRKIQSPQSAEDIIITNVKFEYNLGSYEGTGYTGSNAGGLGITGTAGYIYKATVNNASFKGNYSPAVGGGLRGYANVNIEINNSTFELNKARYGGGAYTQNSYATPVVINNSTFIHNIGGTGGALNGNTGSAYVINNTDFIKNNATGTGGGAIYTATGANNPNSLTINGGVFYKNTSTGNSAGIGTLGVANTGPITVNITNAVFSENEASDGAAIRASTNTTLNLTTTNFYNNKSSTNGGVLSLTGLTNAKSVTTIVGGIFDENTSVGFGAAIYRQSNALLSVTNTKFLNNIADNSGAGIYATGNNGSEDTFNNVLFYNNKSTGSSGGGITIAGAAKVKLVGATFYQNEGSMGGAIRLTAATSELKLYNSILYDNTARDDNTHDISPTSGATLDLKNTLTQVYGSDGLDGVKVGATPLFLSLDEDDAMFLVPSGDISNPILNTGDNSLVPVEITTDLTGVRNRKEGTVDMGAYEYSLVLPVSISSFTAKLNNSRTNLYWSVGTENNVSHYEVERSQNGLDFTNIATVNASGSSSYNATDNNPSLGINYYRLKTVDKDGSAVYFNKVQSVNVAGLAASVVAVYPNPARDIVKISGLAQGNYSYKLVNTAGATVQQGNLNTDTGINVSGLKAGMYVLQLSNGTQLKLIKR